MGSRQKFEINGFYGTNLGPFFIATSYLRVTRPKSFLAMMPLEN
jgi:hypothetical protein